MSSEPSNESSLFNAARKIQSGDERKAYLREACGGDTALEQRVAELLSAYHEESQFLEKPAPGLEETMAPHASSDDLAASLDAGLVTAFSVNDAVVLGDANHSVLRSLGNTIDVPRVVLRESAAEGADPITRPKSPEMPTGNSDSRYRLDGEIARGGMGAIIKGRDTDLGRDLAIKVLLDAHKDKPEVIQRFIEEAQIGGQLQHPGIAPIYELGQFSDKRPFFAMKLVKGETLSKLLADREDAADERGKFIGIFEQICQTMAYAHSRGVIHRDLKPANIMVGAFGEVQVMDWGLAKVLQVGGVADEKKSQIKQSGQRVIATLRSGVGSDSPGVIGSAGSHTQMGSVMGTPAYMPPEQAMGEIDQMDERADVFGLGAILCEILTGKPPYVADDGTQVYRMASRGKLDDCFARLDRCEADAELISLTRHCLELEPANRPRNAGILAESVAGYLESVETRLRETELAKADAQVRAEELKRRNKLALTAGTAIVATLLIGISVSVWQALRATHAEGLAKNETARATEAEKETANMRYGALVKVAQRDADLGRARQFRNSLGLIENTHGQDLNGWEYRYLKSLLNQEIHCLELGAPLHAIAWSPKGDWLTAGGEFGVADFRQKDDFSPAKDWAESSSPVLSLAWNSNGELLALRKGNGSVEVLQRGSEQHLLVAKGTALAWSSDGKRIALGQEDGQVVIYSSETWAPVERLEVPSWETRVSEWARRIRVLAWSPDDSKLAVGYGDGFRDTVISVFSVSERRERAMFTAGDGVVMSLCWNPDGSVLLASGRSAEMGLVLMVRHPGEPDEEKIEFAGHDGPVRYICCHPNGDRFATAGDDHTVKVWSLDADRNRCELLFSLLGHNSPVNCVAWSPEGDFLASSGSGDATIRIWDGAKTETATKVCKVQNWVQGISWSPDGHSIAAAFWKPTVTIWDTLTGVVSPFSGHRKNVDCVAWKPSGGLVASACDDRLIKIWSPDDHGTTIDIGGHKEKIKELTWHPEREFIALRYRKTVELWNTKTRQRVATLPGVYRGYGIPDEQGWTPNKPKWSRCGKFLAVCASDGTIAIYAVSLGATAEETEVREEKRLAEKGVEFTTLAWSSCGLFAAGTMDGTVCIWTTSNWSALAKRRVHDRVVESMDWHPSDRRLATGSKDGTVKIMSPEIPIDLLEFRAHGGKVVRCVAWSPDGEKLATAGLDSRILIWDIFP